ncbi:ABC transporter substrate-binding protein [Paenibacillus sp. 2TAB23]|uniref:ABC transporter substrate-binding protein n=1 Tax=Paenibacillus sp. 2TAB23 TaxID=3233004 RepID=UPI003F9BC543
MDKRRICRSLIMLVAAIGVLTGCSIGNRDDNRITEPVTIRVMYDSEESFYQQYGMLFSALYPEIEIEVVPTQAANAEQGNDYNAIIEKLIDKEKPDVVLLDSAQYKEMSAKGRLRELDTFARRDPLDEEGMVPGVMDYLREMGGGKLNGMTPVFYSKAIYYNKDLFDHYNIPYPSDRMSWDELLQLAARFPADKEQESRVYGLKLGGGQESLYKLGDIIGHTMGLSFVKPAQQQVTVNTESWKMVYEMAHKALTSGALYRETAPSAAGGTTLEIFLLRDPFVAGRAAMAIDGSPLVDQIIQAQAMLPDKALSNWDVVTMPVNPSDPEYGTYGFHQIFAINSESTKDEAAWAFIDYVNSEEYARVRAKGNVRSGLSVRKAYIKDDQGHNLEAFYGLKPSKSENDTYKDAELLSDLFISRFDELAERELQAYADGETPLDKALESLQTKAQSMLEE